MGKEIVVGVLSSIVTAIIMFLVGSSIGVFEKKLTNVQVAAVAGDIIENKDLRNSLILLMEKSGKFKGEKGDQGKRGEQGIQGIQGIEGKPGIDATLQYFRTQTVRMRLADCKKTGSTYNCTGTWDTPFSNIKTAFFGRTIGASAGHAETIRTLNWVSNTQFNFYLSRPWVANWNDPQWVWEFEIVGIGE